MGRPSWTCQLQKRLWTWSKSFRRRTLIDVSYEWEAHEAVLTVFHEVSEQAMLDLSLQDAFGERLNTHTLTSFTSEPGNDKILKALFFGRAFIALEVRIKKKNRPIFRHRRQGDRNNSLTGVIRYIPRTEPQIVTTIISECSLNSILILKSNWA